MDFTGIQTRILSDRQAHLPASVMAIGAFDGVHRRIVACIAASCDCAAMRARSR